jgi:uncharacterized protein YdaU (DUF1376 family)
MFYYSHHIGDFIKDTSRLTDTQAMAYLRLIWLYYDTEKPFNNDIEALAFKIGSEPALIKLIVTNFFEVDGDVIRHSRCDKELDGYKAKSEGGKKGAEKRWGKKENSIAIADPMPTLSDPNANRKPITDNHIKTNTPDGVSDSVFKDFKKLREKHKAPITNTALKGLQREADKAQLSLEAVMVMCCERGWRGFKAEWVLVEESKSKDLPLGTDSQIEAAYRAECGDPAKSRFNSYYEMKNFVLANREKRKLAA